MSLRHIIPLIGDFVADDFYVKTNNRKGIQGFCEVCDQKCGYLREHFQKWHAMPEVRSLPRSIKNITSERVPKERVFSKAGKCSLCKDANGKPTELVLLKDHFIQVHGKEFWQCPFCNGKYSPLYQRRHLQTHSGQVVCEVPGCSNRPISYYAAKEHFDRNHKGLPLNIRYLSDEEFKESELLKEAANAKKNNKRKKRNVVPIGGLTEKLRDYEIKRSLQGGELALNIDLLFAKFLQYFSIPIDDDIIVVKNLSFITLWKVSWSTPLLVFEVVPKTIGKTQLQAKTFHADPQLAKPNQAKADSFLNTGYVFGHMASGSNYRDLLEFIPTHMQTNICPMRNYYNLLVRPKLEKYLREVANAHEEPVCVAHFPIMRKRIPTKLDGVRVAEAFGCVMLTTDCHGTSITAWEMDNDDQWKQFKDCVVDPFLLLGNSSIPFRKYREDFHTVSRTVPPIPTKGTTSSSITFPTSSLLMSATRSKSSLSSSHTSYPDTSSLPGSTTIRLKREVTVVDDSSSDPTTPSFPFSTESVPSLRDQTVDVGNNPDKSYLTPLMIGMDIDAEPNNATGDAMKVCRKRELTPKVDLSRCQTKKMREGLESEKAEDADTSFKTKVDRSRPQQMLPDPDVVDFKIPRKKGARERFEKLFKIKIQTSQQHEN